MGDDVCMTVLLPSGSPLVKVPSKPHRMLCVLSVVFQVSRASSDVFVPLDKIIDYANKGQYVMHEKFIRYLKFKRSSQLSIPDS